MTNLEDEEGGPPTQPTAQVVDDTYVRTGEDPTEPVRMDEVLSGLDVSDAVPLNTTAPDGDRALREPVTKQRIGPFQITGILGSGGMGMVYRARGPDGTPAAVKVLSAGLDAQLLRRFQREATIRIEHPNVVRVLAADIQTEKTPYIAFELLEGQSFDTRIGDGPIPHKEALDVAVQACRGLRAAHQAGVVHRDLKPANIFVCSDGVVKVLDFGIALLTDRETRLTASGAVMGTPSYLSPEQARGEVVFDARTDVWGMGAVMYHALSGKPPFRAGSALATIVAVLMEPVEPLSRCAPSVPPALAAIVERALAKPRDERWASIEEMLAALERLDVVGPLVDDLAMPLTPSQAVNVAGEQRVVAVLLAYEVRDQTLLEQAVVSRGGKLLPIAGGCVLGLFGVDDWSGEEVHQAVAAGQAALQHAGRVAVTSGHATKIGARFSGGALTAAEVCCAAELDGLLLNAEAARAVAGMYNVVEDRPGVFRVRGRQRPSSGGRSSVDLANALIGRDAELGLLRRAMRTVTGDGRAAVALITGPAGIGKGRLRQEVQAELLRAPADAPITTLLARARPHQRSVALSVLRTMLESRADQLAASSGGPRLDATAPLGERQHAVFRLAQEAIADRRTSAGAAEFLGELLGVPMPENARLRAARADPQLMLDRLRGALRDYSLGLLERGPVGLFVEELQWADAESLRFLADLAEHAVERPALVLGTARPELDVSALELRAVGDLIEVPLSGLASFDVAVLARAIARRPLSDALVRALYERTGGNPLFVEQIVTALADEGRLDTAAGDLPLPLTVEAAVQARLDHLPGAERDLLKRASILGRPFYAAEIIALGVTDPGSHLDSLARRGLLASRTRQRGDSGPEWRFKSALVADVASRMISDVQRLELHRRAASYLADLPDTDPEELARHYEHGETKVLAAKHYAHAAIQAARRGDSERVLRCAGRAQELGAPKAMMFSLRSAESEALQFLGRHREQQPVLSAMLHASRSEAERARALTETVKWNVKNGDLAAALETGREAVAEARNAGSPEVLALALGRFGFALTNTGDHEEAARALAEAEDVAASCPAHIRALTAAWRAHLATARGDLAGRREAFEAARAMYREAGDLRRAAGAEVNLADLFNRIGAYEDAERALRQALDGCRKVGNRPMEGYALLNLGYSLTKQGRTEEALAALALASKHAESLREPRLGLLARVYTARAALGREVPAAATVQDAEDAAVEAEGRGLKGIAVNALAVAALARLAAGDAERAHLLSTRALTLLDALGSVEEDETEVYVAHARALVAGGKQQEARALVQRGWRRANEIARGLNDEAARKQFLATAHRELSAGVAGQ